jgi:hypothetical protein
MTSSQFRQMESRLTKAFLAAKTAASPRTASDVAIKGYELGLQADAFCRLLSRFYQAYNTSFQPVQFSPTRSFATGPFVEFDCHMEMIDALGPVQNLDIPLELQRLGAKVHVLGRGDYGSGILKKMPNEPQVFFREGGRFFTVEVYLPASNHPGVASEGADDVSAADLKTTLGGALKNGVAWGYEYSTSLGGNGMFSLVTSPYHGQLLVSCGNDVELFRTLAEVISTGSDAPSVAALCRRLGAVVDTSVAPNGGTLFINNNGKALKHYRAMSDRCEGAWEDFMAVALAAAGVPDASRFGTHYDELSIRFVFPDGKLSKSGIKPVGKNLMLFDPLKHTGMTNPAGIRAVAQSLGKRARSVKKEAMDYVG